MEIYNDGLPIPVFEWIKKINGEYSRGDSDISVTELISPPKVRLLKEKNKDKIRVAASTLINVTLGNAVHHGIEEACRTGVSERRLSVTINGWKISGGMDHWHDGVLSDWKTANKWKTVMSKNGRITEFEQQLNIYAHILRANDIEVKELKIFTIFKDWNKGEYNTALKNDRLFIPNVKSGYPEKEWLYFNIPLWAPDEAKAYVEERVELHQKASESDICSDDDTWSGRRCAQYCVAAPFCSQFNQQLPILGDHALWPNSEATLVRAKAPETSLE